MMLTAAAAAFLLSCARLVGVQTMAGLIEHESGWHEFAIGDNTTRQTYFPKTYLEATELALKLRGQGHDLDAGLAQINTSNWARYGLDEYSVFDPCTNVRAGASILRENYRTATGIYPPGDIALAHALSAYNSGQLSARLDYASDVIANARRVRYLAAAPARRPTPLRARSRPSTPTILSWALPVRKEHDR